MADTTIMRNNASMDLRSWVPAPQSSHTFVSVDSLTNPPSSSMGSASVLDWNSNSDGEVLEWPYLAPPTPPTLTAPASPPVSSASNALNAPVESNGDHLVKSRSSFDAPEPENVLEPCNSTLPADLSRRTLSHGEQFQVFNLNDDLQNTNFSNSISRSRFTPPQFSLFNSICGLQSTIFSTTPMTVYDYSPSAMAFIQNLERSIHWLDTLIRNLCDSVSKVFQPLVSSERPPFFALTFFFFIGRNSLFSK
jgi:hypothetical protein